jgi:hypothetical protein
MVAMRALVYFRRSTLLALGLLVMTAGSARAETGLQSVLTATSGVGAGHVAVSPTAHDEHDTVFIAQGAAAIHDALPDTTYLVQRAVDFTPGDGVCSIAPAPPAGWLTLTTLTTSPAGAGAAHFLRISPPPGPRGFQFDVIFRVIRQAANGTPDSSQVLVSDCMTVTVK